MTATGRWARSVAFLLAVGCGWSATDVASSQSSAEASLEDAAIRTPAVEPTPGVEGLPAPEPEGPLSLEEALTLAMMYSPEMAEFAWEVRASEGRVVQAKKWVNPELDLRLWKLSDDDTRADLDRSRAILSQEFELGGERGKRVQVARLESDLAEWDYNEKRLEVSTTVKTAFFEVLGAQKRIESILGFVEFGQRLQATMQTLVDRESASQLELHQLSRQLGLARVSLRRAEADLAVARFELAASWGSTHPKFTEVLGDLEKLEPLPGIDLILQLAAKGPAMSRRETEVAWGQASIRAAKASRTPDIGIGVGIRRTEGFVSGTDYILDFEIPLPLADRSQGDIREAQAQTAAAKAGREATRAATSREIAEFYYRALEAEAASRALRDEVVPASRMSLESHRLGFANQLSSVDDLLDARRDVSRAETDLIEELVEYQQALAELEKIVGQSLTD